MEASLRQQFELRLNPEEVYPCEDIKGKRFLVKGTASKNIFTKNWAWYRKKAND
jgi:hypothetical protein